ncbi:DUF2069 domain-containing protein [Parahaliea mediterranea]|uniref:DUF2069 domain-containing protein n=1 Tax=Parahaliea mediterranea TaxID=651086 RepID=A0A939DJ93_9GAMM|nr:DUF2069 domain-containing protein [Parahaliea mediterranea]
MSLPRGGATRLAWQLTWLGWAVLFGQQLLDALLHGLPWILWLGKLLPLVMFLPGMLRDRLRSYIWLCFVCLLYFIALVERLFAVPDSALAICGMLAVVTLFCAAMLYVRWRARDFKATLPAAAGDGE